jgi:dihydroorotate dehydrogenase (fumarate)
MQLKNPVVAGASPLTENLDNIRRMEDAGAAAIVMHSLFEEQITLESENLNQYLHNGEEAYAEALSYFPDLTNYNMGPEGYLEHIAAAKKAVGIPVIASLNGVTRGGWVKYAKKMQDAGADALELNIYTIPTDPFLTGAQLEQNQIDLIRTVKRSISIPLAVKMSPSFSALANVALQFSEAGADGLVMFNRTYQPDLDLEKLDVMHHLQLSDPLVLRMRLRWVAIIYGHIAADMAITGGVHGAIEVLKAMMVGAKIAQMTSALLRNGIGHIKRVVTEMERWMELHEYESVKQMQGSMSHRSVAEPAAFERANYLRMLSSYTGRQPLA